MAKATGIDVGGYEVKVVELDGSLRRPRLVRVSIDQVEPPKDESEVERARAEARSVRRLIKEDGVSVETASLGFPCREAVLRNLRVPFTGVEAIRKVVKFEVENTIHSHSVDEMVVDFHVRGERAGTETDVLVAAVPKPALRSRLEALEAVGVEPETVDLDTMALFRAGLFCGALTDPIEAVDSGEVPDEEVGGLPEAEEDAEPPVLDVVEQANEAVVARLVIDVGARSTRLVAATAHGRLIEMRAVRVGLDSVAHEIAKTFRQPYSAAQEAVTAYLSGEEELELLALADDDVDVPASVPATSSVESPRGDEVAATDSVEPTESGQESDDTGPLPIDPAFVGDAHRRMLGRLRREMMRFLTSLGRIRGVEAVFLTGTGVSQEVWRLTRDVFGVEPRELDVLSRLQHDLSEEEAASVASRLAVAVGLALGMLGSANRMNFRREDLAYTRGFDRIKFPLGIACMLTAFLMFIYGMRLYQQLNTLSVRYGKHQATSVAGRGGTTTTKHEFFGFVGLIVNEGTRQYNPNRFITNEEYRSLIDELVETPTFERLPVIRKAFLDEFTERQQATGIYEDLTLPSGFAVLARFVELIQEIEKELGGFVVSSIDLDMEQGRGGDGSLSFTIAFRGEDFRAKDLRVRRALEDEFKKPSSPFKDLGGSGRGGASRGERVFTDGAGAWFDYRIELRAAIDPF
jgi:type IV pilus assembly protein PilM